MEPIIESIREPRTAKKYLMVNGRGATGDIGSLCHLQLPVFMIFKDNQTDLAPRWHCHGRRDHRGIIKIEDKGHSAAANFIEPDIAGIIGFNEITDQVTDKLTQVSSLRPSDNWHAPSKYGDEATLQSVAVKLMNCLARRAVAPQMASGAAENVFDTVSRSRSIPV